MIKVKDLHKRYGDVEAVRGVSFEISKGMIYGFLGPNGAGKSTTMNIITGCLAATSGDVTVNGCDIYEDPIGAKSAIGYLPEQPPLYTDMTPEEYLLFVGEAKGLRAEKLYSEVERVIAKTGLSAYSDRLIKNLSKGYKQRVGIAQAIIGDPEIIILDEPTVGLDPRQIIEIRELIRELGREHTVILSSHILTEISTVCDYVIIISKGTVVASDTLENLTKLYEGKNYVDITLRGDVNTVSGIIGRTAGVIEYTTDCKQDGTVHARISVENGVDIREELFFAFADARIPMIGMEYEEVTLEKVFLELTGSDSQESARNAQDENNDTADSDDADDTADSDDTDESNDTADSDNTDDDSDNGDYKPLFS